VPLGGSFEMQLQQNGSFTLGTANFSLMYYLRSPSTAYNFHFAVEQGEMALRPYGWFSKETATGSQTTNIVQGKDAAERGYLTRISTWFGKTITGMGYTTSPMMIGLMAIRMASIWEKS
jgi:hypothetical protein